MSGQSVEDPEQEAGDEEDEVPERYVVGRTFSSPNRRIQRLETTTSMPGVSGR